MVIDAIITGAKLADRLERPHVPEPQDLFIGGEYRITKDIDSSWGYSSSLTLEELNILLSSKFLAEGLEFALSPSKVSTHRVVQSSGVFFIKLISEISEETVVEEDIVEEAPFIYSALWVLPYWRVKKKCHLLEQNRNNVTHSA